MSTTLNKPNIRDRIAVHTQDSDSESEGNENEDEKASELPPTPGQYSQLPNDDDDDDDHDNANNTLTNQVSQYVANQLEKNTKTILFPAFTITALISSVLVIFGFLGIFSKLFGLIIILLLTIITAYIAMYASYKWGEVNEYIDFCKQQNDEYRNNTEILSKKSTEIKKQVNGMESHVHNLQNETVELNDCIQSFDELHNALKQVCGDDEEILNVIDALNKQYTDMKLLANQKDKAELLLAYYRVQFGGQFRGRFGVDDYQRFVGRLNMSTRQLYDDLGGFEALDLNKDGNVDPEEFMFITEKVLANTEETFVALGKQKTLYGNT